MNRANYRMMDVMKKTKDIVNSQMSESAVQRYVTSIVNIFHPTHLAISVPMDSNAEFLAYGNNPNPLSIEDWTRLWFDKIHDAGCKVLFRGTFSGQENIYNFGFWNYDGVNSLEPGTRASAPTDGQTTWLGKTWDWLETFQDNFEAGDVFAPFPEPTGRAFGGNFFLDTPNKGTGLFADFFNDLKHITDDFFGALNMAVVSGYTANNYSEIRSGWIPNSVFTTAGVVAVDYYGAWGGRPHTVPNLEEDIRAIYNAKQQPVFWQEYADIHNPSWSVTERIDYMVDYCKMITRLINEGVMNGFNWWGGWEGVPESVVYIDSDGAYQANVRGQILSAFYQQGHVDRILVHDGNGRP